MLARAALVTQIAKYDTQIRQIAQADRTVRRLMTVPDVGPLTALTYASTIDDPHRFTHASDVGAYLVLAPRRYQSGELDRTGRISKRGDHAVARRPSPLKLCASKLTKRIGSKKVKVAVVRKLAVILH